MLKQSLKDGCSGAVYLIAGKNGTSSHVRLFNESPKVNVIFQTHLFVIKWKSIIFLEGQYCYYLTLKKEDNEVHTFPKGIHPRMNIIAQLEFELTYYNSEVLCFNHYTTTHPSRPRLLYCHSPTF